jgi:hypothetical protein
MQRKYRGSSFLTPESVAYLNEAIKKQQTQKLDDELIYAGLQNENINNIKYKRTEKNKQRYKGRKGRSQKKRKNRHA